MQPIRPLLAALLLAVCALPAAAQTIRTLGYNTTNGQVVANTGTNLLRFTNSSIEFANITADYFGATWFYVGDGTNGIQFETDAVASITRTNLGLGATWLTNTNVTNFRSAIGLGATNSPVFGGIYITNPVGGQFIGRFEGLGGSVLEFYGTDEGLGAGYGSGEYAIGFGSSGFAVKFDSDDTDWGVPILMLEGENTVNRPTLSNTITFIQPLAWSTNTFAATTRTNLGLGATNIVTFAGITNNGDIRINQTTSTNGLLFVFRTNNEPFLGMANLIASNNTTLSNETLFRVGRAEATNQSAQFGFRVVRTNNGGEGFATFSVFGYNALMMIGPSDRSRTNTATNAAIEADIWTINQTNRVMTLRDTNTGALTLHQELGFSTGGITTNAPANTTNVALWLRIWVGGNNYRLPLYQ